MRRFTLGNTSPISNSNDQRPGQVSQKKFIITQNLQKLDLKGSYVLQLFSKKIKKC